MLANSQKNDENRPPLIVNNNYLKIDHLGKGAYGEVYKGIGPNNESVALKEILIQDQNEGIPLSTLREISVLKKLQRYKCDYLIKMYDVTMSRKDSYFTIYIVFEFVDLDLYKYLKLHNNQGLPLDQVKRLSYQLIKGVEFLHSHRIVHRDLKTANILIDKTGSMIKITDFGLSKIIGWSCPLSPEVVTLWYRAPEVILRTSYLSPCDIWSVGCIIVEMINGVAMFQAECDVDLIIKIIAFFGCPDEADWPHGALIPREQFLLYKIRTPLQIHLKSFDKQLVDVLMRYFEFNPNKRITATASLQMPYFFNHTFKAANSAGTSVEKTVAPKPPPPRVPRHSLYTTRNNSYLNVPESNNPISAETLYESPNIPQTSSQASNRILKEKNEPSIIVNPRRRPIRRKTAIGHEKKPTGNEESLWSKTSENPRLTSSPLDSNKENRESPKRDFSDPINFSPLKAMKRESISHASSTSTSTTAHKNQHQIKDQINHNRGFLFSPRTMSKSNNVWMDWREQKSIIGDTVNECPSSGDTRVSLGDDPVATQSNETANCLTNNFDFTINQDHNLNQDEASELGKTRFPPRRSVRLSQRHSLAPQTSTHSTQQSSVQPRQSMRKPKMSLSNTLRSRV